MNLACVLKMVEIYCAITEERRGKRPSLGGWAVDDTGKDDEWGNCMNAVLGKENDTHFLYSSLTGFCVCGFFFQIKKKVKVEDHTSQIGRKEAMMTHR